MRIIINEVTLDIKNGGELQYDSDTDTLRVLRLNYSEEKANTPLLAEDKPKRKYTKKVKEGPIENPAAPEKSDELPKTKSALVRTVLKLLREANGEVSKQFLTRQCLGSASPEERKVYFHSLLEDLAEENKIYMYMGGPNKKRLYVRLPPKEGTEE